MDLVTKEFFWGSGFNPHMFPGLQLWFDGADASSIIFGTPPAIATWKDKSGNANNGTQVTVANQPTQDAAALNGLNTVKFTTAGSQVFNLTSAFSLLSGYTALMVIRRAGTGNIMIPLGSSLSAQVYMPLWFSDSKFYVSGTGSRAVSNAEVVSTFNLVSCGQNAAENNGFVRFNRSDITASQDTTNVSPMTNINLIGGTTSISDSDGDIAEYLLYSSVLSLTQIQTVENYLRNKWATP